jgi:hypothetical protein
MAKGWSDEARRAALEARQKKHPPKLPFVRPPDPKGQPGRKAGGMSAVPNMTNTQIGDIGEASLSQLGLSRALPENKRQGPFDVYHPDSGWFFEVKTCTTLSQEYKAKMKGHEREGKQQFADENGIPAATMILVMDPEARQAWAYWREGIGSWGLGKGPEKSWHYMGHVVV